MNSVPSAVDVMLSGKSLPPGTITFDCARAALVLVIATARVCWIAGMAKQVSRSPPTHRPLLIDFRLADSSPALPPRAQPERDAQTAARDLRLWPPTNELVDAGQGGFRPASARAVARLGPALQLQLYPFCCAGNGTRFAPTAEALINVGTSRRRLRSDPPMFCEPLQLCIANTWCGQG
jgi:hypothetical protein